jgi:hypothetical protein
MELQTQNARTKGSLLVDLGDAGNFANEAQLATKRIFGFSITNGSGAAKTVLLFPSYIPSVAANVVRDGAIPYTGGATDLTAASTNTKTVAEILAFIAAHPTRIQYMQVESNLASQLTQQLLISQKSIFNNPETEVINLASFKSPTDLNDKMVIVKKDHFQADIDTEMSISIPDGATTTFTFYCGGVWNECETLYKLGVSANQ